MPRLTAGDVPDDAVALIPSAEIARLQERFAVVPDIAVIQERDGAVAMRVPVRPDEIERTAVRLYDASGSGRDPGPRHARAVLRHPGPRLDIRTDAPTRRW